MLRAKGLPEWAAIKVLAQAIEKVADEALYDTTERAVEDAYRLSRISALQQQIDHIADNPTWRD
jgi:uncharacterized membrane protein YqiK